MKGFGSLEFLCVRKIYLMKQPNQKRVPIKIAGQEISAPSGETIVHALWRAGMGELVRTGCVGGVCGACTVTIRFPDDRPGGTDLACLRLVEEGMEIFPCPVEDDAAKPPVMDPRVESLQQAFPTLDRCTKCGSCTTACPMTIPVMDSVLRMQEGRFEKVGEDFTTCIHCGLCRFVCEDRVKPHNMALWVRRSLGTSRDLTSLDSLPIPETDPEIEREWDFLLRGNIEERLEKAKRFRKAGRIEA